MHTSKSFVADEKIVYILRQNHVGTYILKQSYESIFYPSDIFAMHAYAFSAKGSSLL